MEALKFMYFTKPETLCEFVNYKKKQVVDITQNEGIYTLFYKDK